MLEGLLELDPLRRRHRSRSCRARRCEIQGYVYDAKVRCARLARKFWNDPTLADRLEREAAELKARFNRDFWMPDRELLRAGARRPGTAGRFAHVEHRPPAVERDRRRGQGRRRSCGTSWASPLLRLGRAHDGRGRGRATTPSAITSEPSGRTTTRSSRTACIATATARSGAHRLGHPAGGGLLPRSSSRGVRRLSARRDALSRRVSHRVQPAGLGDGGSAAAAPNDDGARTVGKSPRRRRRAASGDRVARASRAAGALGGATDVAGRRVFARAQRNHALRGAARRGAHPRRAGPRLEARYHPPLLVRDTGARTPASSTAFSAPMMRSTASMRARCEKACGKLPRCRDVRASISSA